MKNAIGPRFERPQTVRRWVNARDKDDALTLGRPLDAATFCGNVEDINSVDNGGNAHDIVGYLKDPDVARAIAPAL